MSHPPGRVAGTSAREPWEQVQPCVFQDHGKTLEKQGNKFGLAATGQGTRNIRHCSEGRIWNIGGNLNPHSGFLLFGPPSGPNPFT